MPHQLDFRPAVRAVLLDPTDRVLLVKFVFPNGVEVWALPGGGLDAGETNEDGLRRELAEELGLVDPEIGPHVWTREHIVPMRSGQDGQRDVIHLVRVEAFDPEPQIGWDQLRAEDVHDIRWWTLDELDTHAGLRVVPRRLTTFVRRLLADGPPDSPIAVGV